ncbi:hypothetical protein J6590_006467 [Homalodisca vitripennis]|nr:hypothetical protein J6590_006467 [Homalodisca vitripennis]
MRACCRRSSPGSGSPRVCCGRVDTDEDTRPRAAATRIDTSRMSNFTSSQSISINYLPVKCGPVVDVPRRVLVVPRVCCGRVDTGEDTRPRAAATRIDTSRMSNFTSSQSISINYLSVKCRPVVDVLHRFLLCTVL